MEVERHRTFIFPHCGAHVKGKTHLAKSFEKQYRRCQERGKTVLSLLFSINYRCTCVCFWGICVQPGWVKNSCQQAGTASSSVNGVPCMFAHVITVVCFSTCCWGSGVERWVRKGAIVPKPVGRMQTRERQLTVWSPVMSGQVLAGWLLCAVSRKTICLDDSIKGNHPARKPLVIAQPAFQAEECKTGTRERENTGLGGAEER